MAELDLPDGPGVHPVSHALMGKYAVNLLAVSIFGAVFAFNTVLFLGLQAYIVRALITPELAAAQDPHFSVKGLIGLLVISHRRRGGAAQRPCRLRDLPSHAAVLHH